MSIVPSGGKLNHVLRCHEMVKSDLVQARDCLLFDADGRTFVDFEAGVWCANLGHGHSQVLDVIRTQSERLAHIGYRYTNETAEHAAVSVLSILGRAEGRCLFLSSGSEAVEFAVGVARRVTKRPLLLTLAGAYLSAYGSAGAQSPDAWHRLPWSECEICPISETCDRDCAHLETIPFRHVGGFVFDSGNMHGTVRFPPTGLVRRLTERVRENGGLVVANEITTGMGRTGTWFGFEHYKLEPDLVALGKGLGNGYPVSAVALTPAVADRIELSDYRYVQSHQNDPLACAVAVAVIDTMNREGLVDRSRQVGAWFLDRLRSLSSRTEAVRSVRGRGLMIVLELDSDLVSASSAYEELLRRRFLVGLHDKANLLRFYPPLTIGEREIERLIEALTEILPT